MVLRLKTILYGTIPLVLFFSFPVDACHELTARDRSFWKELYSDKKTFFFALEPISVPSSSGDIYAMNEKGMKSFKNGIYPDAGKSFEEAIGVNPDLAPLYHNLALVSYTRLKLEKAAEYWETAAILEPDNPRYRYHLATALSHDGRVDEAIDQYSLVIALAGEHPEIFNQLGQLFEFKGDMTKAIKNFEKAVNLKPDYMKGLRNLAKGYERTGRMEEARSIYENMITINPKDVELYINLGNVYVDTNQPSLAIENYEKAVELRPDYPYPHFLLSEVYKTMGKTDEADGLEKVAKKIRIDNYIGCIIDPLPNLSIPKRKRLQQESSLVPAAGK